MKAYAKAIVGALVAAASFAAPVVDDGLAPSEVLGILLAALVGFQTVYWTSNTPTPPRVDVAARLAGPVRVPIDLPFTGPYRGQKTIPGTTLPGVPPEPLDGPNEDYDPPGNQSPR